MPILRDTDIIVNPNDNDSKYGSTVLDRLGLTSFYQLGSTTAGSTGDFDPGDLVGNTFNEGRRLEITNGASLYSSAPLQLWSDTDQDGTGAQVIVDNASLFTAGIRATWILDGGETIARELNITEDNEDACGTIRVTNGRLDVGRTDFNTYQSMFGNQGNSRLIFDNAVVSAGYDFGSDGNLGTGVNIFYLGYRSNIRDSVLTTAANFEVLANFADFRGNTLTATNPTWGDLTGSNPKPIIYQAGKANSFATIPEAPEVILDGTFNTGVNYYGNKHQNTYIQFNSFNANALTSSHEFSIDKGGGSGATNANAIYFNITPTASVTKVNTDTSIENAAGRIAIWNADKIPVLTRALDSDTGTIGDTESIKMYEFNRGAFTNSGIVMPIGYPDSRTDINGMRYFATAGNYGAQKGNIIAASPTGNLTGHLTAAVAARNRNGARRGWPYNFVQKEYGYNALTNLNVGSTAVTGNLATTPWTTVRDANNAGRNLIRDGLSLSGQTSTHPVLHADTTVDTKAKVDAITGYTLSVSGGLLNITSTDDNVTLNRIFAKSDAWVVDQITTGGNIEWSAPTATDITETLTFGAATPTTNSVYTTNVVGNTASLTTAAANTSFAHLRGIRFSSTAPVNNHQRGGIMIWRDANNYGVYTFHRDGGDNYATGRPQANLVPITTRGTIGSSGTVRINLGANEFCLTSTTSNTVMDYLVANNFDPITDNGTNLELRNTTLAVDEDLVASAQLDTIDFMDSESSITLSDNAVLNVNVEGLGTVRGFTAGSTPCIGSAAVIGTGTKLEFDASSASTYRIAGDIRNADLRRSGTNIVTLVGVSGGQVPLTTPEGFRIVKEVTVQFNGAHNWLAGQFDSELDANMVAFSGTSRTNATKLHVPHADVPSSVTGVSSTEFTTGNPGGDQWSTLTWNDGVLASHTAALPSGWADMVSDRVNGGIDGIEVNIANAAARARILAANPNPDLKAVIFIDSDNWGVFTCNGIEGTGTGDNIRIELTALDRHDGVPNPSGTSEWNIYWTVDSNGSITADSGNSQAETTSDPTIDGMSITYTYEINAADDLYFAFSARQPGASWYSTVMGDTRAGNVVADLTVLPQATVPPNHSTGAGLATQRQYFRDTDVVVELTHGVDEHTQMTVSISNVVTTGNLGDGVYIHRLMQQKTNYLENILRGYYPIDAFRFSAGDVQFSATGVHIEWLKAVASNNIVQFETQATRDGISANTNITGTQLNTEVRFRGVTNTGVLNESQGQLIENILDGQQNFATRQFVVNTVAALA